MELRQDARAYLWTTLAELAEDDVFLQEWLLPCVDWEETEMAGEKKEREGEGGGARGTLRKFLELVFGASALDLRVAGGDEAEDDQKGGEEELKKGVLLKETHENERPAFFLFLFFGVFGSRRKFVSTRFVFDPGTKEGSDGQGASFCIGTAYKRKANPGTVTHRLPRYDQSLLAMDWQFRGSRSGSKFAHGAGAFPPKEERNARVDSAVMVFALKGSALGVPGFMDKIFPGDKALRSELRPRILSMQRKKDGNISKR
jgi:hypothetical protein